MEYKQINNIEYKKENDQFIISGYASIFDVKDHDNDILEFGSFQNSIANISKIKFLWQHEQKSPIGTIDKLYEDKKGLFLKASINSKIPQGLQAINLVKTGLIDGLSVGFTINKSHYSNENVRIISDATLWEISLVTFPANEGAKIINYNSKSKKGAKMEKQINSDDITKIKDDIESISKASKDFHNKIEEKYNILEASIARPNLDISKNDQILSKSLSNFIRKGVVDMDLKSLSSLSDESGGYTVLPQLYKHIMQDIESISPMRKLASKETISTNFLDILLEEDNFGCNWVREGDVREETNTSKLKQKRISVHELYAQPKATQKLLDDSAINLDNWLIGRLKDAFVRSENDAFINGDGNLKPRGILSYDESEIENYSVKEEGKITMEDILEFMNLLDEQYLAKAKFIMHRSTLLELQKIQDKNGRFLWQNSYSSSHPDTLLGIPVICIAEMPRFGLGKTSIALSDFKSSYKIIDRQDISVMRDPYTEKPFVKFYSVKRVGGDVVNTKAIKLLKV